MNGDHDHEIRIKAPPDPRRWTVIWTALNVWSQGAKGRSVIDFKYEDAKRICTDMNRGLTESSDFKYAIEPHEPTTKGKTS